MNPDHVRELKQRRAQLAADADRLAAEIDRWPGRESRRRLEQLVREINMLDLRLAAARSSAA